MRPIRALTPAALLLTLVVSACSEKTSQTILVPPQSGRYALTGRVQLSAALYNLSGVPQGTWVVNDASGVRIRVEGPGGTIDSVQTLNGAFELRVDTPGHYRASCWVVAPDTVATSDVTIVDADVAFPDTLKILPTGGFNNAPNPFPLVDGTGIEFTLVAAPSSVQTNAINLAGTPVWSYTSPVLPVGFEHVHWAAIDDDGNRVPPGRYWTVLRIAGGPAMYNLVFSE